MPRKADGKPLVSNGGVQNFLERRGLNLMKARINFAEEYSKTIRRQSEREKTQDNKNYMKEAISLGRV
ncbi:MAG: hypothetical protein HY034_06395 [Nitrospirae bacterium]|nr:hypothetical protein [Nitrospirota bacterium]